MAHGEDNGLMSISLFLKLPPLNSPSALPTALQGQRLYNSNEKLEGNFNINEENYITQMRPFLTPCYWDEHSKL